MTETDQLYSHDAEVAVLSLLLKNSDLLYRPTTITPNMFSATPHQLIYKTITDMAEKGLVPDAMLLRETLKSSGTFEQAGGESYLKTLTDNEAKVSNYEEFESIVLSSYKRRSLISILNQTSSMANSPVDVDTTYEFLRNALDSTITGVSTDGVISLKDALTEAYTTITKRVENPGIRGYTSGYISLDRLTGGTNPGDVIIVAGRPSMGKTAFICNSILRTGLPSLVFSKEMNTLSLIERLTSIKTGIDLQNIRLGALNQDNVNKIHSTYAELASAPIYIDSNFNSNLTYMLNTIRRYNSVYDVKTVYIDYIQLLAERNEGSTHELGRISRAMKLLANELDIAVYLVSQLNRSVEMRDDKKPILADLRQSGNLEEDADIVLMLYRDKVYNSNTESPNEMLVLVRKNRNGPVGFVPYKFNEGTLSIDEVKGYG